VIYIPAGLTGYLALRRRGYRWLALAAPVVICALLSATIEMVQLWAPSRDTSLLDFVVNVTGAIIGVILANVLEDALPALHASASRKPADRSALALLGCGALWMLFPLMPITGRYVLHYKLASFRHAPVFDPLTIFSMAVVWFAAGELLQAARVPAARKLILFSILIVPARFLIIDQRPLPAEMIGAALGAIAWSQLRQPSRWIAAAAFFAAIVLHGLTPFVFVRETQRFSWIPFAGFLHMNWQQGIIMAAGKFFWYGTAVWLLRRLRVPKAAALAVIIVILLGIEIAQLHIPGHVADITDPLLALAAGWSVLALAEK
jgi:VanZ family protein